MAITNPLKHLSLPVKTMVLTILVGTAVWALLDYFQTKSLRTVLQAQLLERLEQQVRTNRILFNKYVNGYHQAVKLYISQKEFQQHITEQDWSKNGTIDIVQHNKRLPPWFPGVLIRRLVPQPRFALLLDGEGRVRELYSNHIHELPPDLLSLSKIMIEMSHGQAFMTTIDEIPYLLTAKSYHDQQGQILATLLLACPMDDEFLIASLGSARLENLMALVTGNNPSIMASSDHQRLPPGIMMEDLQGRYLVAGSKHFDYGVSDLQVRLAFFVSTKEIDDLSHKIITKTRQQRALLAIVLILSGTVLMYWVTYNIKQLSQFVVAFTRKELGALEPEQAIGDELVVLRERFQNLTGKVVEFNKIIKNQAREETRFIVDHALDAVIATNADGMITTWNPSAEIIFGWSALETMGKNLLDIIILPKGWKENEKFHELFQQKGQISSFNKRIETPVLHRDGHEFFIELSVAYTHMEDANKYILFINDINERKHAENALLKSEEKYRRLVENLKHEYFFYSHDTDGVFQYLSPSIFNVLGYSEAEFSKHYTEFYTENPINKEAHRLTELSVQGLTQPPREVEVFHKDGSKRILEVVETPIRNIDGQVIAVEGIAQDITKRMRLEKKLRQAQKMEAIGTLAGGIAHDFNNILTPILGFAEILYDELPDGSRHRSDVQEVINAGNRAKELVKQILSFSRETEHERKPIMIQYLLKETLKLLRASIPSTIEIRQSVDTTCGAILADSTQIHQVVMNLCTNAYHAMRETGGILGVKLEKIEIGLEDYPTNLELQAGKYLKLEVSDTGHGMDKALLDRIFEPYFTTKEQGEGTGLGLSVVHGIVKSHNGHLTVYSEPGKGTTFHVYLPQHDTIAIQNKSAHSDPIARGNERILIVDDDETIVKLMKSVLTDLGYHVTPFTNSREAWEEFQSHATNFDLVLTDMTMPEMTGAELAQEVIRVKPDIPIILCTGFSEMINEEKAKMLGIRKYIMKPIIVRDFANAVRKTLDEV